MSQRRNPPWQFSLSTALSAMFVVAILFASIHWMLRQPMFYVHIHVPVTGTVKLSDGTSIASGEILFQSSFQPRIIHGGVIENGRFELYQGEGGAVPGEYYVSIRDAIPMVNRRYEEGAFSATVSPFGKNEFTFVLKP